MFIFRQDKQDYQDKNPVYLVNPVKKDNLAFIGIIKILFES